MANPILEAFQWGAGGAKLTPEQVARQREIAAALMQKGDPAFHNAGWLGAIGRGLEGAYSGWSEGRANRAETEGRAAQDKKFGSYDWNALLGGSPAASTAMATEPAPDYAGARVAQAHGDSTAPAVDLSESKQAFISNLLPAAIEESKRTGVDPRIIVAQAAQETGWGRSAPGNNYFGIKSHGKGGGQSLKTHEYVNGKRVNITDSFRRFDSPADSVRGYGDFILQNPRYRSLREAQGLDAQLAALQASGYATDPNYSKSVGAIARGIQIPNAVAANEAMASGSWPDVQRQALLSEPANPATWPDRQVALLNEMAGVPVAETPQDILAQEAAMAAQDPMAFQQPAAPLAEPRMVNDMPVADISQSLTGATANPDMPNAAGPGGMGQGSPGEKRRGPDGQMYQYVETSGMAGASGGWGWIPVADDGSQGDLSGIAQALTANQVNPDLPMAGNASGFLPVAQSLAAQPQPQQQGGMPNMQQLIELASDPWATDAQRGVVQALLQQQMQAQDPMRQAQLEKLRLETEALRNPAAPKPIEVGGVLLDPITFQPVFDSRDNTPSNVREYEYYANAETAAGRQPMPFGDWDQSRRRSGATNVTTNVGGENLTPGQKKIDEAFADTYLQWQSGGYADSAKQLDQLNESLGIIENAAANGENISGVIGALPTSIQPFINPQGTIAREGVEEVVQRSLREILGAQFTEKEGERLIARAYNPLLPPAENAKRVRRLIGQVQGMAEARQAMVDYFDNEGTLRGFKGKRPSLSQLENIESEWEREDNKAGREFDTGQSGVIQPGTVQDGYRFKGGDPANPNNWEKQ